MTNFLLKLILITPLFCLATPVFANWTDVEEISISKSRPLFDRTNRVYVVNVEIQNNSADDIVGPLRVLVNNATLEVVDEDGVSESGSPYFVGCGIGLHLNILRATNEQSIVRNVTVKH